jgi:hypothetical protein
MKTIKMSLANLQGKMSRKQMKVIMGGGSGTENCANYNCGAENKRCCSSWDMCSDASSKGVCVKRK